MELSKKEKGVLKALLEQELARMEKESKSLFISNSPFLHKIALDDDDLAFLKTEAKYQELLGELIKKLD